MLKRPNCRCARRFESSMLRPRRTIGGAVGTNFYPTKAIKSWRSQRCIRTGQADGEKNISRRAGIYGKNQAPESDVADRCNVSIGEKLGLVFSDFRARRLQSRVGQIDRVFKRFIPEPEQIQTEFVPGRDLVVGELAPVGVRVLLLGPGGLSIVTIT